MNSSGDSQSDKTALERAGLRLTVGPFRVRIRSSIPAVADHLQKLYFPASKESTHQAEAHFDLAVLHTSAWRTVVRPQATLFANGEQPFLPLPSSLGGPLFEWGLNWCVGRHTHRFVVVHAAVVERNGRALILPASPGAGKSTLCAALVYSGWRLLSDEFALIDPVSRKIHPIPRPISLKDASIEVISRRYPDVVFSRERVDVEGARFVHARPPRESVERSADSILPGWIVVPRYSSGSGPTLLSLPKARMLMQMADQSFNYNYLGPQGYLCLADVVRQSACFTFEYSEIDDALELMGRLAAS